MTSRALLSSAIVIITALGTGCGKHSANQRAATQQAGASSTAPGMRYEAHLAAGGVSPPTVPPTRSNSPANAKAGEQLFSSMNCDGCHGGGATGWEGPSLVDGRWRYGGSDAEIFQSIFYGRPKGMPAYGGVLGADGAWMIVRYLKSQPVPAVVPTINYEDINTPAIPTPDRETTAPPQKAPTEPQAKLALYGCTACHAVDQKVVGPALRDVAAKYHDQPGEAARLEEKVKNGGSGVWGSIPMPPNSSVPDAEIHTLVNWILTSSELRR
jgi:cytochrome c